MASDSHSLWHVAYGRVVIGRAEGGAWILDEDFVDIAEGLDGSILLALQEAKSEAALLECFAGRESAVLLALRQLANSGLVKPFSGVSNVRLAAAKLLKVPGPLAWTPLVQTGIEAQSTMFEASGIQIASDGDRLLVTTDDYLTRQVMQIARTETRPWLLAKTVGRGFIVGPSFGAGSVCWECMAYWLRTRRWRQASIMGYDDDAILPQPAVATVPAFAATVAGQLTLSVLRWCTGSEEFDSKFRYMDLASGRSRDYELSRRPGCTCGPRSTVPLSNWANPVTGIVFDMHSSAAPIGGLVQVKARHFRPFPKKGARPLLLPGEVYGSGIGEDDAQTRCIAEGLERWSCIWRGTERVALARARDLERYIPPDAITLYSERQYSIREEWNRKYESLYHVAEKFDLEAPQDWVEVRSLMKPEVAMVPAASVYMWHASAGGINHGLADSNGCAAGVTMDHALLGGLLELVERDGVAIWWYNRLQRPKVEWAEFGDSALCDGVEELRLSGRNVVLLDLTTDLGIPTYAAVGFREDGTAPYAGCAAHLDGLTAAKRAFAELIQNWYWSSVEQGREEVDAWVQNAKAETHKYLHPEGRNPAPKRFTGGTSEALRECVLRLDGAGIDAHWIDLTREEIGVPVCRVIAPGLRHCWMRFAPGRLYDVPVKMGWLDTPLKEEEMNPEGCPL
jgi:ribosomal protein S12 methylthiotransferase accessory factor